MHLDRGFGFRVSAGHTTNNKQGFRFPSPAEAHLGSDISPSSLFLAYLSLEPETRPWMLRETGSLAKVPERWKSEIPTIQYELGNSLPLMRTSSCCPGTRKTGISCCTGIFPRRSNESTRANSTRLHVLLETREGNTENQTHLSEPPRCNCKKQERERERERETTEHI